TFVLICLELWGNTQVGDLTRGRCCLRVNKSHVEVRELLGRMGSNHVKDGPFVTVNLCAAFGKVITSDFKILEVETTVVLHGEIRLHHIAEACRSPFIVELYLG